MDKTLNINISGILFQVDEEAFRILRDYLQAINNRFMHVQGGHETVGDIESRIAEILQSQKGLAGVITKENVETMISIIGKPEDFDLNEDEPISHGQPSQRKRMYRNPEDTIISGVCGGIGAYLNTDPVIFRILFVLFTVFFGAGILVYIALWIALPPADTDTRKREMYGSAYNPSRPYTRQSDDISSRLGNAFNEIFGAIGRVLYIGLRILLIIIGVTFVLTGFITILSFVLIFLFKMPNAFTADGIDMNLAYFTDFLNYIVNPGLTPWIIALALITLLLPMLALIYWGVKMIFWFKASDGVFSLVGLVIWVMALSALAIILFNDGISFAETAKSSSQNVLSPSPDTLYIKTSAKISGLKYDKVFRIGQDDYTVYINDDKKELYIRPYLNVNQSDDDVTTIKIKKRSSGRSRIDALENTEGLIFNSSLKNDTLLLDEYFTVPSGRKWSADNIGINIYIPQRTILKFDSASEKILLSHNNYDDEDDFDSIGLNRGSRAWILTDDGLRTAKKQSTEHK